MPGPAGGPGMGRRGGPGMGALCLHPLRRDGLAAFIGGPIPAVGVLDA